uniref:Uncharacterized protein n=1 Tax=Ascaris lumbricoides TaxID=6252 RepID=A0A0M3IME3_ASCLU
MYPSINGDERRSYLPAKAILFTDKDTEVNYIKERLPVIFQFYF